MAPLCSKPEGEQKQSPTPQKAPKQQARRQALGLCFVVHIHDLLADEFFVFVLGTAESWSGHPWDCWRRQRKHHRYRKTRCHKSRIRYDAKGNGWKTCCDEWWGPDLAWHHAGYLEGTKDFGRWAQQTDFGTGNSNGPHGEIGQFLHRCVREGLSDQCARQVETATCHYSSSIFKPVHCPWWPRWSWRFNVLRTSARRRATTIRLFIWFRSWEDTRSSCPGSKVDFTSSQCCWGGFILMASIS